MSNDRTLNQIMKAHYSASKGLWLLIALSQLGVFGLGVFSASHSEPPLLVLGGIALGAPVLLFVLRLGAGAYQAKAEEIRRLEFARKTVNHEPTNATLLQIRSDASKLPSFDPEPDGEYFGSDLPFGPQRMAHCAEERAFFTRAAARTLSFACAIAVLGGVIVAVFSSWFLFKTLAADGASSTADLNLTADLFGAFFVFFGVGSFSNLWGKYSSLAKTAGQVFHSCDQLRQQVDLDFSEVYLVVAAYDVAVAETPPLPGVLYRFQKKKLNALWRKEMAKVVDQ
tara:strand:+ start:1229 stop:2077 length:849 start_codon:yes stop_codon:yes gene_type:complete